MGRGPGCPGCPGPLVGPPRSIASCWLISLNSMVYMDVYGRYNLRSNYILFRGFINRLKLITFGRPHIIENFSVIYRGAIGFSWIFTIKHFFFLMGDLQITLGVSILKCSKDLDDLGVSPC